MEHRSEEVHRHGLAHRSLLRFHACELADGRASQPQRGATGQPDQRGRLRQTLQYDLYDSGDELCLRAFIPGAEPSSLELTFNQGALLLKGYRSLYSGEEERRFTWYVRSLREGEFQFAFSLPVAVNPAEAEATYENGLLTIRLPKAAEARVRRIAVNAGAKQETLAGAKR
jgi:HSP20 family protein